MNRPALRRAFLLIPAGLACFALFLSAQAQLPSPTPDGGYPNGNTAEGTNALFSLTTGNQNTATGFQALFSNTTGYRNTAAGSSALFSNTTGYQNTATGFVTLYRNTTGRENTATGYEALYSNTTGGGNTATGAGALQFNTTGTFNTATGLNALLLNTTGYYNTANGWEALYSNTTGPFNTANGYQALFSNTTVNGVSGYNNTANGVQALFSNTTGSNNTANGGNALHKNQTGSSNTAMGVNTLYQSTGNNNIAIGSGAGSSLTMGNNNIDIGNIGVAGEANTIRIGSGNQTAAFIAGISGATVTGTGVVVSASGQLGTAPSSARFKEAIKPMDKASEAILALKPVTFRYKEEIDPDCIPQFGLVAEEVEKVNPDLVACDRDGKPYTVRYDAVNTMLLNEFLKQHRKVEEQEATIAQLKKNFHSKLAEQQKQIRALASGLEKLSAQLATASPSSGGLEASKFATGRIRSSGPAPQIVLNDQ